MNKDTKEILSNMIEILETVAVKQFNQDSLNLIMDEWGTIESTSPYDCGCILHHAYPALPYDPDLAGPAGICAEFLYKGLIAKLDLNHEEKTFIFAGSVAIRQAGAKLHFADFYMTTPVDAIKRINMVIKRYEQ